MTDRFRYIRGRPYRKWRLHESMRAGCRVFLPYRRQRFLAKFGGVAKDGRPKATMDVGHFATQESTNQNVGRLANGTCRRKNKTGLGMSPPASSNALTRYRLG